MKKRSFRSTFVSVILVITVAISIVNLAVYGINIKKIRQVEVLKMKTAGERIDDMITISLNNIKGLKQICCTDNYARNILLKNNEKNDIGTKFENQNYMDNALKHIASMDTLILRAMYYSCAVYISTCVYEKYQTKGQSILNVVQLGLGAIVGNLVGGKLIRLLGYEKGYLLMAGITTLMTICALIVYFWKNREQRNGGDVCEI